VDWRTVGAEYVTVWASDVFYGWWTGGFASLGVRQSVSGPEDFSRVPMNWVVQVCGLGWA